MKDLPYTPPRPLRAEEFEELIDLLNRNLWYNATYARRLLDLGLDSWRLNRSMEDILVIEQDGKLVSHTSIYPFQISVRGCVLKVGEISAVATDEKYRGRGFMSSLLRCSIEKMTREGYDLSSLGGLRNRYGRFGWELAGEECVYTVDRRSIRAVKDAADVRSWQYTGEESDLRKISEQHDIGLIRTLRPWQHYQRLFSYRTTWLAEVSGLGSSYLVLNRQDEKNAKIVEYGGNPDVFKQLVKKLFEDELEKVTVHSPNIYTPFAPILNEISSYYSINAFRMLKIINLEGLLKKTSPIIEEKLKRTRYRSPFTLTLEVPDVGQRATLDFNGSLSIHREPSDNKIVLDQRNMVRLLFGPGKASKIFRFKDENAFLLDTVFPLDFYIWELDRR